MNELIETIFEDFTVDNIKIPVSFLYYEGHGEPFITYLNLNKANSFSGDNELLGYVDYYDFNVYSKGNYIGIIEKVRELLENNGFIFQPSRCSADMYEVDTGYYHKTLNFAYMKEEI